MSRVGVVFKFRNSKLHLPTHINQIPQAKPTTDSCNKAVSYNEITGDLRITARKNLDNTLSQLVSFYAPSISLNTFNLPLDKSFWFDTSTVCPAISSINPLTGIGYKRYWNTNGTLIISKVDWSTGIIAGTFEYDVYSPECADTVRITQGRFDVRYKY